MDFAPTLNTIYRPAISCLAACLIWLVVSEPALAQPSDESDDAVPSVELGEEYTKYKKTGRGRVPAEDDGISFTDVLLYLPNRFLDLVDIFRVDVGVGPALGGVVRVTKYGQVGLRTVSPFSLRAGLQGRHSPVFLETSNEFGVGPAFVQSHDREVMPAEIGAGLDLIVVGAYIGIDLGAIPDFFAGVIGFDLSDDDLE